MSMQNLVEIRNLKKYFPITGGLMRHTIGSVKAVDNVSFDIIKGETLGLVGESGCGKSTLGRCILRLIEPTSGSVSFEGNDLLSLSNKELREERKKMQIIFQDPYASLNPRMTIGSIISEPLQIHKVGTNEEIKNRTKELLSIVGLQESAAERYPHEFSGGQRQRVGIARALALNPEFVVCDEPVSALDVSVRSQVLNLMNELKKNFGLTFLFISHDLSVVKHISDRVAVMYLGQIVEIASKEELYVNPLHPYTKALLSAIPIPDPTAVRDRIILKGDVPSPANPPKGCHFCTRCPCVMDACKQKQPEIRNDGNDHYVACFQYQSTEVK